MNMFHVKYYKYDDGLILISSYWNLLLKCLYLPFSRGAMEWLCWGCHRFVDSWSEICVIMHVMCLLVCHELYCCIYTESSLSDVHSPLLWPSRSWENPWSGVNATMGKLSKCQNSSRLLSSPGTSLPGERTGIPAVAYILVRNEINMSQIKELYLANQSSFSLGAIVIPIFVAIHAIYLHTDQQTRHVCMLFVRSVWCVKHKNSDMIGQPIQIGPLYLILYFQINI